MGGAVPLRAAGFHPPPFKPYVRVSRLLVLRRRLQLRETPPQATEVEWYAELFGPSSVLTTDEPGCRPQALQRSVAGTVVRAVLQLRGCACPLGHHRCLQDLAPGVVLSAAREMLAGGAQSSRSPLREPGRSSRT
jgi:hypothetical protein